nr:pi-plc x domain-containing protein 1 [Quercus suber]
MKSFALLIATLAFASGNPLLRPREQVCNGNAAFCDRIYSNVSLIGTHDSAFVGSILDPRINQEKSVADQLEAGIRFMEAQTHKSLDGSTLELCHTSCLLEDAGALQNYLATIKTFLDANPNEVITLLLTNGDNVDVSEFDPIFSASGLKDYAFVPKTSPNMLAYDDWPTYGQLISAGSRLVMFLDYGANETKVNYILDEYHYFFDTPYDTTDPNFPECTLARPPNASPDGRMYIVNHFLDKDILSIDIPDNADDFKTNAATGNGSIGAQADLCTSLYGRVPNFVLVDMFDRGDVFTAQNTLNGL